MLKWSEMNECLKERMQSVYWKVSKIDLKLVRGILHQINKVCLMFLLLCRLFMLVMAIILTRLFSMTRTLFFVVKNLKLFINALMMNNIISKQKLILFSPEKLTAFSEIKKSIFIKCYQRLNSSTVLTTRHGNS